MHSYQKSWYKRRILWRSGVIFCVGSVLGMLVFYRLVKRASDNDVVVDVQNTQSLAQRKERQARPTTTTPVTDKQFQKKKQQQNHTITSPKEQFSPPHIKESHKTPSEHKTTSLAPSSEESIPPKKYQNMLGVGIDVDWLKTKKGMDGYSEQVVKDFKARGFSHVRLRVKEYDIEKILPQIKTVVSDCLRNGLIPILAFQADDFKNNPNEKELQRFVSWWGEISQALQNYSQELSFDLIIEVTDALNKKPNTLNTAYEKAVKEIRKTNPNRNIFISPVVRSAPENLHLLKIPTLANGHLLAEFHFYASGPSKTNPKKRWTTGTKQEKQIIKDKIQTARAWQRQTGIPVWAGAWMPGNYNKGDDYSVEEQTVFARFVASELKKAHIPFAINSGHFFYDYKNHTWIDETDAILDNIFR